MSAIWSLCLLSILATMGSCAEPIRQVEIDVEWNALFTRTDGWTGGDVAGSIDLLDGRTLWVFGDSWFGKVRDGKHAQGSTMVNNSVAVHPTGKKGKRPSANQLTFVAGPTVKGKPSAWVVPRKNGKEKTWYWTNGGGVIVPAGPGDRKLIVFLFHLTKKKDAKGVWAFQSAGGAMAVVENVEDPIGQWRPRSAAIPHAIPSGHATQRPTSWGVAVTMDAAKLYLYGIRDTAPLNKQLLLARVPLAELEDVEAWRFYGGDGRWSEKAADAVPIADGLVSELSVSKHVDVAGEERFVLIQSEPVFGTGIFARTAQRPEGPWTARQKIYEVPDVRRDKDYFTYAAKGHAHLSRQGELLVSYLVNSHDFGKMVNDPSIYRPKFVRVPLKAVLER